MFQSLVNLLYREPKSHLKTISRFGGYFSYRRMLAGKKEMEKAARDLDFIEAARLRDEMFRLQKELESMK